MSAVIAGAAIVAGGIAGSAISASDTQRRLGHIKDTPYVDPNQVYSQSLGASLGALPQAENLTGQENVFNQQQLQDALNKSIPGYSDIQASRSGIIQNELAGQLPPDVQAYLERTGAATSLAGGYGGSQAGRNLTARDLGTNSLNLMHTGQQEAQQMISGTPTATPISIAASLGLNPELLYKGDLTQRQENMAAATNWAVAPGAWGAIGSGLQKVGGAALSGGVGGG